MQKHPLLLFAMGRLKYGFLLILLRFFEFFGANQLVIVKFLCTVVIAFGLFEIYARHTHSVIGRIEFLHTGNNLDFGNNVSCVNNVASVFVNLGNDTVYLRFDFNFVSWLNVSVEYRGARNVCVFGVLRFVKCRSLFCFLLKVNKSSCKHGDNHNSHRNSYYSFHNLYVYFYV